MKSCVFGIVALVATGIVLSGCGGSSAFSATPGRLPAHYAVIAGRPAQVWDMNRMVRVRELPFSASQVSVSADRTQAVFLIDQDVKFFNFVTSDIRNGFTLGEARNLRFGPGLDRITYNTSEYLISRKLDGSDLRQIVGLPTERTSIGTISPNGELMVTLPATTEFEPKPVQLRTGSGQLLATHFNEGDIAVGYPAWSPDSRTIAFFNRPQSDSMRLFTMDVATGATKNITPTAGVGVIPDFANSLRLKLSWSPNGRSIIFSAFKGQAEHMFRMNADGTDVELIGDLDLTGLQFAWTN